MCHMDILEEWQGPVHAMALCTHNMLLLKNSLP